MKNHNQTILIVIMILIGIAVLSMVSGGSALAQESEGSHARPLAGDRRFESQRTGRREQSGISGNTEGKQAPAEVVAAENRDRREAYQVIANQTKTSIEVGRADDAPSRLRKKPLPVNGCKTRPVNGIKNREAPPVVWQAGQNASALISKNRPNMESGKVGAGVDGPVPILISAYRQALPMGGPSIN